MNGVSVRTSRYFPSASLPLRAALRDTPSTVVRGVCGDRVLASLLPRPILYPPHRPWPCSRSAPRINNEPTPQSPQASCVRFSSAGKQLWKADVADEWIFSTGTNLRPPSQALTHRPYQLIRRSDEIAFRLIPKSAGSGSGEGESPPMSPPPSSSYGESS